MVFTMFIDVTRFRFVQLLTWLFPSKLEVHFFIARQADQRAIKGTELYTVITMLLISGQAFFPDAHLCNGISAVRYNLYIH